MVNTCNKSCFSILSETIHVKQFEEYEMNTDQLTNLGYGGASSTCPTTKVILPHTWGNMTNTGCLIVKKNHFYYPLVCRSFIITLNDSAYNNNNNNNTNNNNNNNGRSGSCLTWLATSLEEKRRWLIINASARGQCSK